MDSLAEDKALATADVATPAGALLHVRDEITMIASGLRVARTISEAHMGRETEAFASAFAMQDGDPFSSFDGIAPGVYYGRNEHVPPNAMGSASAHNYCLFRETRMAGPYVALYRDGISALLRYEGTSDTGIYERDQSYVCDASLQYPSLGFRRKESAALMIAYPGSEGENNYTAPQNVWSVRTHPLDRYTRHQYTFSITLLQSSNLHDALAQCVRMNAEACHPQIRSCQPEHIYEASIRMLADYTHEYAPNAMGIPFWTEMPDGDVVEATYQMGFVGQQPMCAYHMMRYGLAHNEPEMVEKAEKIVDFWATQSLASTDVLPHLWYDASQRTFKQDYPCYLRTLADGLEGMLCCYRLRRRSGINRTDWLDYTLRIYDQLLSLQNTDGSFYRGYWFDGRPAHEGKFNTTNPIREFVELYWLTGNEKYLKTAVQAGEFSLKEIVEGLRFVGGTADNENIIDKEAGQLALYAFLALYDVTGETRWIDAARIATDFIESWTHMRTFPVRPKKGMCIFAEQVDMTGLSMIATGHSHSDVMMAYMAFDVYRLALLTQDAHLWWLAEFLYHNTRQTMDLGRFGCLHEGAVEESGELALQYHNGLGRWLPWCTIAEIEPLTRFEELYGTMAFDALPKDSACGRLHGSSWLKCE